MHRPLAVTFLSSLDFCFKTVVREILESLLPLVVNGNKSKMKVYLLLLVTFLALSVFFIQEINGSKFSKKSKKSEKFEALKELMMAKKLAQVSKVYTFMLIDLCISGDTISQTVI